MMIKILTLSFLFVMSYVYASETHIHFDGKLGSKHIVFLSGDEEYRSEEAMPMLAQMMNRHYGFECSVLFSLDDKGFVKPDNQGSLANPEVLNRADMIVMFLRFRKWDNEAMQIFENAYLRGIPIIALRTSTHAFLHGKDSEWHKYSSRSTIQGWEKGFGKKVLGEWWGFHHGRHKVEGGRSVVEDSQKTHEILRGVLPFFCKADVYTASPPKDATILLRGEVTQSLDKNSPSHPSKNNPMHPIAWTREVRNEKGKTNRVFMCMMGASIDLKEDGLRRLIANSIFWGFEMNIPDKTNITIPSSYNPTMFGFGTYKKNMKPSDFIPVIKSSSDNPN